MSEKPQIVDIVIGAAAFAIFYAVASNPVVMSMRYEYQYIIVILSAFLGLWGIHIAMGPLVELGNQLVLYIKKRVYNEL